MALYYDSTPRTISSSGPTASGALALPAPGIYPVYVFYTSPTSPGVYKYLQNDPIFLPVFPQSGNCSLTPADATVVVHTVQDPTVLSIETTGRLFPVVSCEGGIQYGLLALVSLDNAIWDFCDGTKLTIDLQGATEAQLASKLATVHQYPSSGLYCARLDLRFSMSSSYLSGYPSELTLSTADNIESLSIPTLYRAIQTPFPAG